MGHSIDDRHRPDRLRVAAVVCLAVAPLIAPLAPAHAGSPTGERESLAAAKHRPSGCHDGQPGPSDLLAGADMLLLGEIHGSDQIPAFVLEVVCRALDGSRPVVVGLEIWSEEQEAIDRYLRSAGTPEDRRRLIAGPFWTRPAQDGRASVAVVRLIEGVRKLVETGAPVSIFCFDERDIRPLDARDRRMAMHLLAHREANPEAGFVVLTGNVHARTAVGVGWNPEFRPMGLYLDGEIESLRSLVARNAPGEFWVCNPDCGAQSLGGLGTADARGVELFGERDDRGYDGLFDIGVPTASKPAVSALPVDD
jgi:hypothetical protein